MVITQFSKFSPADAAVLRALLLGEVWSDRVRLFNLLWPFTARFLPEHQSRRRETLSPDSSAHVRNLCNYIYYQGFITGVT